MSNYNLTTVVRIFQNMLPILGNLFLYKRHTTLQDKLNNTPILEQYLPPADIKYRTDDGSYNNIKCPYIGMKEQPFGRFMKPIPYDEHPSPELVVETFFKKHKETYVEGANLFVAAWIQFMIHDWFEHKLTNELIPEYGIHKTHFVDDNLFTINTNSHFWDGSQIYKDSLRMKDGTGKLRLGNDGYLPLTNDTEDVGNGPNKWYGIMLLHLLFTKEHNYICDILKSKYPLLDDNELYGTARLVVTALIAKIHTIEWTPIILGNKVTSTAQHLQYNGLLGAEFKNKFGHTGNSLLSGYPQGDIKDQGVNFSHIEEFSSIYRMHSLLPDTLTIDNQILNFEETLFDNAKTINTKYKQDLLFESMGRNKCTSLDINNYPNFLRHLHLDNRHVDLALVDIYRDRERGLPRYNEFRRQLLLTPIKKWSDLTKDKDIIAKLKLVYGNNVEALDLLVGTHIEEKLPKSIFGETIYSIFVLHTTRRVSNDRFLTINYNKDYYTEWGMEHIYSSTFKDVLVRHYPTLNDIIPENAFLSFT